MNPWPSSSHQVWDWQQPSHTSRVHYQAYNQAQSQAHSNTNSHTYHQTPSAQGYIHSMNPAAASRPHGSASSPDVVSAFISAIERLDTHLSGRLNRMEVTMTNLAKVASDALQVANGTRQETKEGLDRLQGIIVATAKHAVANSDKIQRLLGKVDAADEGQHGTVFGRVKLLERAIVELTESVSDSNAARPTIVRNEVAVNTSPVIRPLVDAGMDAIQCDLSAQAVGVTIDAEAPRFADAGMDARSPSPVELSRSTSSQLSVQTPVSARFPILPFTVQPLTPAQWSPEESSDESSSQSNSNSKVSSPKLRAQASDALVPIPRLSAHRGESANEEQEILQTLEVEMESSSQVPSSLTSSFSPLLPLPEPYARPSIQIPRRLKRPITTAPSASSTPPSTSASTVATAASISPSTKTAVTVPAVSTAQDETVLPLPGQNTPVANAPLKGNPPVRVVPPIPRGLGRGKPGPPPSENTFTSTLFNSSQASVAQKALLFQRSDSLSSLSSLSTARSSSAASSRAGERSARASARLRTMSTRDNTISLPGASASVPIPGRGRSRSATRGGKAAASARVPVKKERMEKAVLGRSAKRRKVNETLSDSDESEADGQEVQASTRHARGGSRGGRGRGGRGGGPSASASPRKGVAKGPKAKGAAGPAGANKEMYQPPRVGTDCPWPDVIDGDEAYQREFVQCDNCEGWYHFGCVGLERDDPRLNPDAQFVCPPCESSDAIRTQRQGLKFQEAACARPDCDRAGLAKDTNEYFVERIIGRRPYDADIATGVKRPTRFLWLVKWDGWKAEYASWTKREHLGDCARFIEEFEQAAEIEGRDLNKYRDIIALNEAVAVGW